MTTGNNDPFATPTSAPQPPAAPGVLSPTPAAVPPPGGFAPPPMVTEPPNALALWTIILTGIYTLLSVIGAITSPAQVDAMKEQFSSDTPSTFGGTPAWSYLSYPVILGAYVVLALWWGRIRAGREARGVVVGGLPAVEWWGWLVPLANFVLPYLGMRSLTRGLVSPLVRLAWWIPFCLTWILVWATAFVTVSAIDLSTGELANADALDAMVPIAWASAICLVISWIFLTVIVRTTTAKHLEA